MATSRERDCAVRIQARRPVLAVASIYRDAESLMAEVAMEQAGKS